MPTTIETTIYQFDELSDDAKQRARAWYREASADDSFWSEHVIDDAATACERMGFNVRQRPVKLMGGGTRLEPAIYFSGFWSQGDGACFEGSWSPETIMPREQFCAEYPAEWPNPDGTTEQSERNAELQRIHAESLRLAQLDPGNEVSWRCKHRGHGNAEYNTEFEHTDERCAHCEANTDCTEDGCVCVCDTCNPNRLDEAHEENARDAMRWIYRQLEREWEWINSDEQIDETIRCNEYTFTENGRRF